MLSRCTLTQTAMKNLLPGVTRLSVAFVLALSVHALVLWVVGQQMQPLRSSVQTKPAALRMRQITQANPSAAPGAPPKASILVQKKSPEPKSIAQPAIKNEAFNAISKMPPESPTITSTPTFTVSSTVGPSTDTLAMQGSWPIDTRLTYDLVGYYRGELLGNATLQWTREGTGQGEGYQMRIEMDANAVKVQLTSQGRMLDKGLVPNTYEEQLLGRLQSVAIEATSVVLGNGKRIPLLSPAGVVPEAAEGVQDVVSQFIELGHRFAQGQARLAEGETVRVWLASPTGLDAWDYEVGPAETMTVPQIGAVQVFPLKPRPVPNQGSSGSTVGTEIWLAPALQYLPVRIKLALDKDAYVDLKAQKIEQRY